MLLRFKLYLKNFDWLIFTAVFLLALFGLVEIYSVALGQGSLDLLNFQKQILFVIAGFLCLFIFAFIDSSFLRSISPYLYAGGLLLLGTVLIFGTTIRGTKGWFYLFGFNLQPVEFVKIITIIALAAFFSRLATRVKNFRHFIISSLLVALPIILVLLQPDFGSAIIIGAVWLIMIMAAGFPRKYYIFVAMTLLVLMSIFWLFIFQEYQKNRVLDFLNPGNNIRESGYNISQAIIAVGSGGLTGKGVGFGSQSQLKFLPEAQTDFIFAVIAEELGFLGVTLVLGFYFIFFFRSYRILRKINNDFGVYVLIGIGGLIFIQMFINIGMNLGIMPVVGLPLPFVSYGGSSLISLLMAVGIIQNIIIKSKISY